MTSTRTESQRFFHDHSADTWNNSLEWKYFAKLTTKRFARGLWKGVEEKKSLLSLQCMFFSTSFLSSLWRFKVPRPPNSFTFITAIKKILIRTTTWSTLLTCGAWWLIGRFVAFRSKGNGFKSRSSHHVGTAGKSFTRSCLWHFSVKLWYTIYAVSEHLWLVVD